MLTFDLYILSLHDALPISLICSWPRSHLLRHPLTEQPRGPEDQEQDQDHEDEGILPGRRKVPGAQHLQDRKSTRLNSSHVKISYAVFCLKKKKAQNIKVDE